MSGPWERYQKQEQPQEAGPWLRYQQAAEAPPPTAQAASAGVGAVRQTSSGINEGIANALGLPVDTVTQVLNLGIGALGGGQIEKPFGGSESLKGMMGERLISSEEPQGAGERFARRIGQEVGAGAVAGPAFGIRSAGAAALNTAADIGSGVGAQTAREVAPESAVAEIAGSMAGGLGVVGAARANRPGPQAPSLDDLRRTQADAYDAVEANASRLTPQATSDLSARLQQRMQAEQIDPYLHPKTARVLARIEQLDQPTVYQVEQARRLVSRDAAGALDPGERRLGQILKDEIDGYLDNLSPAQLQGGPADEAVDALHVGRNATTRIKRDETIADATLRGERRAATSGTGGNEINAIRQNLRAILDNPKKRRGFTPNEQAMMDQIVRGTPAANTARRFGRLAPQSGTLALLGGMGQVAGASAMGNPWLATPMFVGMIAKSLGERMTQRQIDNLTLMIRNGGSLPAKGVSDTERRVAQAVLAAMVASATGDGSDTP